MVVHTALNAAHHGMSVLAVSGEADRGIDGPLRKFAALAGYLSYGLMGASMVWGLTLTTGVAQRYIKRARVR